MAEYNSERAVKTLDVVTAILNKHDIKYSYIGSVVAAAINGKLYRTIGDLDLFIDIAGKSSLTRELQALGYVKAKGMFAFARKYLSLETLDHQELLEVGYFYGIWQTDGSFVMGDGKVRVRIEAHAVQPTKRNLYGREFVSIPNRAIAAGIAASNMNPKRQMELAMLKEKGVEPFPNTYIHISVYGAKADWIYHVSMAVLNVLGRIRVSLGLPFDPWR